jgi:hypothetical protein
MQWYCACSAQVTHLCCNFVLSAAVFEQVVLEVVTCVLDNDAAYLGALACLYAELAVSQQVRELRYVFDYILKH